jgi:autophagy-related protein 5
MYSQAHTHTHTHLQISAPRNGFFTSLIEKVCSHFDKDEDKEKIWFSTPDDKPIQWHLPIGFLYDITCSTSSPDDLLPWIIIVRYSKFPHNTILELASGKTAEENFFHSLKQAMYIQHGTAKSVMSITRSEQSELWTAIMKCTFCFLGERRIHS